MKAEPEEEVAHSTTAAPATSKAPRSEEAIDRTDDLVRMYLREMGSVELLPARARSPSPSASKPAQHEDRRPVRPELPSRASSNGATTLNEAISCARSSISMPFVTGTDRPSRSTALRERGGHRRDHTPRDAAAWRNAAASGRGGRRRGAQGSRTRRTRSHRPEPDEEEDEDKQLSLAEMEEHLKPRCSRVRPHHQGLPEASPECRRCLGGAEHRNDLHKTSRSTRGCAERSLRSNLLHLHASKIE